MFDLFSTGIILPGREETFREVTLHFTASFINSGGWSRTSNHVRKKEVTHFFHCRFQRIEEPLKGSALSS